MKEVLEIAWWRAGVNKAWRIIEGDRRMQKLIEWRIDSQKMEERLLLESMRKEERLEMVGRLKDALRSKVKTGNVDMMEIDIQTEDDIEMDMDWCIVETKEHAYVQIYKKKQSASTLLQIKFKIQNKRENG